MHGAAARAVWCHFSLTGKRKDTVPTIDNNQSTRSTMADEAPPPNDEVFEDAEEEDDGDEDEQQQPCLIERIANNDPAVSTLNLTSFWDLGEPKFDSDEVTEAAMGWWGEFSISNLDSANGPEQLILSLCERHLDDAIEAVKSNTFIKHVKVDAFFRHEASALPWNKILALLKALSKLNLESFELADEHQCCLSEFIDVFDSDKLQSVKIGQFNVEGPDRIPLLADKIRGHPALREIDFDFNFEIPVGHDHILKQTYVVDPLFTSFASIPNLEHLVLNCNALNATSAVEPLQDLLRHPKLKTLALCGLLPNNHMLCKTVVEILTESKGNLENIDLSFPLYFEFIVSNIPRWKHSPHTWITQEMAEMLFSLVENQPSLKVKVSCFFSLRERKTLILNNQSDADWYLQKAEVLRGVRLDKAGMRNLLLSKDGGSKAAWVDLLTRVSDDAQAAFHVLKEQPSICDGTKAGDEKITEGLAGTRTPGKSRYQAKPKLKRRRLESS